MAVLERIGCVSLEQYKKSYRLRFTVDRKTYALTIRGLDTKEALKAAKARANQINGDIALGKFDESLTAYNPLRKAVTQKPLEPEFLATLNDVWIAYKQNKAVVVRETSQKTSWLAVDSALAKLGAIALEDCRFLLDRLRGLGLAETTILRILQDLNASTNYCFRLKLIDCKPELRLGDVKRKKSAKAKEIFTTDEIRAILKSFENSHYYHFVECLALTGRRYEDVIALTWGDWKNDYIIFDKALSNRATKVHPTKNGKVTYYPVNDQLRACLNGQKALGLTGELIFPSPSGKHTDGHNFLSRHWKPRLEKLVIQGEISRYLPLYNLRHSRASHLIQNGVDLATIAYLLETSVEMLSRHYLGHKKDIILPDL